MLKTHTDNGVGVGSWENFREPNFLYPSSYLPPSKIMHKPLQDFNDIFVEVSKIIIDDKKIILYSK